MILQRHTVDRLGIKRRDHRFFADVAEQRDLRTFCFRQGMLTAADENIRLNAVAGQFAHRMLGRLGLQLACGSDIRHQCHMREHSLVAAQLIAHLADRFDERKRLDVAHGPADFAQDEIQIVGVGHGKGLDGVGHMRDDLHGCAEIVAATLLLDDLLIDSARGHIV